MTKNQVIGRTLLLLAIATVVGMEIDKANYWNILNCVTILTATLSAMALLKQK